MVPEFGLYAGIIIDFFYDHLLATNWKDYSDLTLPSFTKRSHAILLSNFFYLPKRVQGFIPFLVQNKRLESYATKEGIHQSMEIMARYTSLPERTEIAMKVLIENFLFFEHNFSNFFTDIIRFVEAEYDVILKKPTFSAGL